MDGGSGHPLNPSKYINEGLMVSQYKPASAPHKDRYN